MINAEIINNIISQVPVLEALTGAMLATTIFTAARGYRVGGLLEVDPPNEIEWDKNEVTVPTGSTVTMMMQDSNTGAPKGNLVIADYREREGVKPRTLLKWARRDNGHIVHKKPFHVLYHAADFAQFFTVVDHQTDKPMGFVQRK
jgi:hypothetical protein